MKQYRVIVVDDSRFMRKIITDLIESDAQFTVVGTASNGLEAISSVEQLQPDVITLDLEMPKMNGIEALQAILPKHKIPIIMLSGISEANTRDTIKALQFGAFDFIRKPTVGVNANDIVSLGDILLDKLKVAVLTRRQTMHYQSVIQPSKEIKKSLRKTAEHATNVEKNARIEENTAKNLSKKIINQQNEFRHINAPLQSDIKREDSAKFALKLKQDSMAQRVEAKETIEKERSLERHQNVSATLNQPSISTKVTQIVAIGTSTGGPRALHEVISSIPAAFSAPIVVVQHMPPKFTKSLAGRLDTFSSLKVVEAEDGMILENGMVYIAPGGYHMKIAASKRQYKIELTTDAPRNGHRPSVDILFESLLSFSELERHIVLMTGMGSDGAQGMKALVDNGVRSTIAESEETCVVYGMPRSVIELGVVEKILPLTKIAPEIVRKVMKKAKN